MWYVRESMLTRRSDSSRNFHSSPIVTAPKTGPGAALSRALNHCAASISATHCAYPRFISSFFASTTIMTGALTYSNSAERVTI